ncbi:MAG: quinone-dependent dihydroorotate dehydrogenase [Nanoarchaeota archaeon]|nr:quinone-dependent dihydroorotate dehydrogenase [Nanoarchaeota archaeon]
MVNLKQKINAGLYSYCAKPVFFLCDPELMHTFFIRIGEILGKYSIFKYLTRFFFSYQNKMLEQNIAGLKFRNPVGLSAGFDKNAQMISIMEDVGFGFTEVGSVTAQACEGNPGKRLARIVEEKSIWVNFGLNNEGADQIYKKLKGRRYGIPFGISVARTNCRETADEDVAVQDYIYSAKIFREVGDFLVLNISCPNAYGGQPFSEGKRFEKLVKEVSKLGISKPIFVKLSPDLNKREIDKIISLSKKYKVRGLICTNLTKDKAKKSGGYSGKIVEQRSDQLLEYVYKKTKGEFILIGVGGIFSAEDAYRKIKLGANLVELITGMIYEGPGLIGEINHGLCTFLKRDGYKNISQAVGKGVA